MFSIESMSRFVLTVFKITVWSLSPFSEWIITSLLFKIVIPARGTKFHGGTSQIFSSICVNFWWLKNCKKRKQFNLPEFCRQTCCRWSCLICANWTWFSWLDFRKSELYNRFTEICRFLEKSERWAIRLPGLAWTVFNIFCCARWWAMIWAKAEVSGALTETNNGAPGRGNWVIGTPQ